jgi:hypothetical protein
MKKSIVEIYAMAVCFVTACALTVAGCVLFYNIISYMVPQVTVSSYQIDHLFDNESFCSSSSYRSDGDGGCYEDKDKKIKLDEGKITQKREKALSAALEHEHRAAFSMIIRTLIILFVIGIVYCIHWRMARQYQREQAKLNGLTHA